MTVPVPVPSVAVQFTWVAPKLSVKQQADGSYQATVTTTDSSGRSVQAVLTIGDELTLMSHGLPVTAWSDV